MSLNFILLGQRIQQMRKKKGYSQSMLSEIVDKSPTYISYIENGSRGMSLETLVDIANALNATADDLLKDSLENTVIVTGHNFSDLLADCSDYEQKVLLEILEAAKQAMRANKNWTLRLKK